MKKIDAKHILVVGSGSVGKRHARNFSALGCKISCVDPRLDRLDDLRKETLVVEAYETLEAALSSHHHFDGVAICSPPNAHVSQSIAAIAAGIPVLLEKPVSTDVESARRLEVVALESGVPLLLGYTWRWWMPLRRVRELLEKKLWVICFMSNSTCLHTWLIGIRGNLTKIFSWQVVRWVVVHFLMRVIGLIWRFGCLVCPTILQEM